jgi:hypothetical protein
MPSLTVSQILAMKKIDLREMSKKEVAETENE